MKSAFIRLCTIAAAVTAAVASLAGVAHAEDNDSNVRRFKHVFVIVLENEGFDVTFGAGSKAPYLSKTLVSQGALLSQYYGTGHASLDNYIAMISGQAATAQTRNDCLTYADFVQTGTTPDGQAMGSGCVYPSNVKTVADQLNAARKTWHAYMGDMGNDPSRESATCGHPVLNTVDMTQNAEKPSTSVPLGDDYASRHNPFVYFHSIIDAPDCHLDVVNLNQLTTDLKSESTTPDFSFITPSLCDDGHDSPCANGAPGGLVSADAFLQEWVPIVMNSPAYKKDGLLIINFDESDLAFSVGAGGITITAEGETCCSQRKGPNLGTFPQSSMIGPYTLTFGSYGGDRTGAVLLSPFITPGTVANTGFNHYSMLKTIEDIFGLDYLGYAGAPGLVSFFGCAGSDVATHALGKNGCQ